METQTLLDQSLLRVFAMTQSTQAQSTLTLRDLLTRYRLWDEARGVLPPAAYDWAVDVEEEALSQGDVDDIERADHVRNMPHLLAYAYEQMHLATHPIIKISWMVNLTELCIRWSATLLIADLTAHFCDHEELILPEWAQDIVRHHIRRPTVGSWVHILRELTRVFSQHVKKKDRNRSVWGLHDRIAPHFSREDTSLLSVRNRFAHDGITPDRARDEWEGASPRIEDLMSAVIEATRGGIRGARACKVLALHRGEMYSLMGEALAERPLSDQELNRLLALDEGSTPVDETLISHFKTQRDAVYLMSETGAFKLLPYFVLFGQVERLTHEERDEMGHVQAPRQVAQIYAKLDQDRAVFTPINSDEVVMYHEDMQSFEAFLGLHVESTLAPVHGYTCEDYVLTHPTSFKAEFFGRNRELDVITSWLFQSAEELTSRADAQRLSHIAWLGGGAGMGKSHLLSVLASQLHHKTHLFYERSLYDAHQLKHQQLPSCPVFYHRFELGDPRCDLELCLRLLAQKLHQSFALTLARDEEERFHELEYLERSGSDLEEYLESIFTYLTPVTRDQLSTDLIIILDAADLLNLSVIDEPTEEATPLTSLIDLLSQLTRASALDVRVIFSTSSATSTLSSTGSRPTTLLAQHHSLTAELKRRRKRVGKNPHARRSLQQSLDSLAQLNSGVLPPLSDQGVKQLFNQASDRAYSSAINELGKNKNNIRENPFLRAVIERSQGSPLYLRLVLDELESGRLMISNAPLLPNGVEAYFFNMLQRVTFGDATRNLPLVLCLLLVARRALSESALSQLVFKKLKPSIRERQQVSKLLSQTTHIFMRQRREGVSYWQFQDPSLKSLLITRPHDEEDAHQFGPPQLSSTYREALERFAHFSAQWAKVAERSSEVSDGLARHLLEFDLEYAKLLRAPQPISAVTQRFLKLPYLMRYVEYNTPERISHLSETYVSLQRLVKRYELELSDDDHELLREWERFFRQRQSILGRALPGSASQALIQLALDDARESVISEQARQWVESNPEVFDGMRLAPESRPPKPLTSLLRYTQTLNDSVQSLTQLSAEVFVCCVGSSRSPAPSEVIVYHVHRGRALWRYTAQSPSEVLSVVVLKRLGSDQTQGICQLVIWSSARIELISLAISGSQCVLAHDEDVPHLLDIPAEKSHPIIGCFKMDERCVIAWDKTAAYVWDWRGQALSTFSFKVKKIRELIRIDDQSVLTHQGKPIEMLRWDYQSGETAQIGLITLSKAHNHGSLQRLDDHHTLVSSASTKGSPPRLDLIKLSDDQGGQSYDELSAEVYTLNHPHQSWVSGVVSSPQDTQDTQDSTSPKRAIHFYTSDTHLIARWSLSGGQGQAPQVDFITSCPLSREVESRLAPTRADWLTGSSAERLEDLSLERGAELRGVSWVGDSPVWYGRRGSLVAFNKERAWLTLDKRHVQGHQTAITQLLPCNDLMISASEDNDIRLWSIGEGELVCRGLWRGHNQKVNRLLLAYPEVKAAEESEARGVSSRSLHLISSDVSKQLNVWRYDLPTLERDLQHQRRQLPFINCALTLGRDKRCVLTGHQDMILTLWDEWGERLVAQHQILGESGESRVTHLYALSEGVSEDSEIDNSPSDSLTDQTIDQATDQATDQVVLVITHKSKQSYLYRLPALSCDALLKYPRALGEHLLIQDAPNGPLFMTAFEREGARHPEAAPRPSHELWAWSLDQSPVDSGEPDHPPTLTPQVYREHQAPIIGLRTLAQHHFISWDESGEGVVWSVKSQRKTQTLEVAQRISLLSAEELKAGRLKMRVSADGRRILAWNSAHLNLWCSGARGYLLKPRRIQVNYQQIHEAQFVGDHLLFVSERRVGVSLYDLSGRRVSARFTLNEAPFSEVARVQVIGDQSAPYGLLIHEHRRRHHVWCWRWLDSPQEMRAHEDESDVERAQDLSLRPSPLVLMHRDQMIAEMCDGSIPQAETYVDLQSEQVTLYQPTSGDVRRWYSTDGTSWSVVGRSEERLILKMNRALYPLVLPSSAYPIAPRDE